MASLRDKIERRLWHDADRLSPEWSRAYLRRRLRCRDAKVKFERAFGRPVDTENPTLFTEKIVARILDPRRLPLQEVWDDKLSAPLYARSKTDRPLYFPKQYGIWREVSLADLAELPRPFIVKANFGSGTTEMVREGDDMDLAAVAERVNAGLVDLINARGERSEPFVLAEELMLTDERQPPADLKFHCFHRSDGSFDWFVQVDTARFEDHRRNMFTSDLRQAAFKFSEDVLSDDSPDLPSNIDEFVAVARDLSSDFDYMRVDLYDFDGQVTFGEFTPWHQAGNTPLIPIEWESTVGKMWEWNPDGYFGRNTSMHVVGSAHE